MSVVSADFSSDGARLALAATKDAGVDASKDVGDPLFLWSSSEPTKLRELKGHPGQVLCVRFNPDGQVLAATNGIGPATLWDVAGGRIVNMVDPLSGYSFVQKAVFKAMKVAAGSDGARGCSLAFSPNGQHLAYTFYGGIGVSLASSGYTLHTLSTGPFDKVEQVVTKLIAFADDGRSLIDVKADGNVRIWDVQRERVSSAFVYPTRIMSAALTSSRKTLATTGQGPNYSVRLWEVVSGQGIKTIPVNHHIEALAFSWDGQYVAAAGLGNEITIIPTSDVK